MSTSPVSGEPSPASRLPRSGLVEFAAAALLVLGLLAGAWTLLQQNLERSSAAVSPSRGEDALRAAFAVLEPELRMAGGFGLTARPEFIAGRAGSNDPPAAIDAAVGHDCGRNFIADLTHPIEARHGYDLACPGTRPAAWSDVLIIRRADSAERPPEPGRVELITTRLGGALRAGGTPRDGFLANARAATGALVVGAFYVGADAPDAREWTLRRQRLGRGADGRPAMVDEALVRGIADLRVVLGVDTDGDGAVDVYVEPGAPELARGRIVSVRVALTAFADEPGVAVAGASGARGGPPPGGRRRLVLEKTVALRNAGSD